MQTDRFEIALFGEVLFDTFEEGRQVLGGAPFNVAYNLSMLGTNALFISRIGEDEPGERIREQMAQAGLSASALQHDNRHPTGQVQVRLTDGSPAYTLCPDQAYDHIQPPHTPLPPWLYHGTLAARSPQSAATLKGLITAADHRFVDVNFRDPFVNEATLPRLITGAEWLKLNHEEFERLCLLSHTDSPRALMAHFHITHLILTKAEAGAEIFTPHTHLSAPAPAVGKLNDTVGAGDGFSAMTLYGLLRGWPVEKILDRALAFAAAICTMTGATTPDHTFYQPFKEV